MSRSFAKEVPVGPLRVPMTRSQIKAFTSSTPLDNSSREFNCQVWVDAALKRLSDEGYLLIEDYSRGVDGMVDATMEAEDEP